MEASVIIITKNQKHLLKQSLPMLLKQDLNGGYEIIVVDSGSTDGAREYVESLPVSLVKIRPEAFNFARAFNTGAQEAHGDFLVRLSGDAIPLREDFLRQILEPFKDPKVGGTFGKYVLSGRKGYVFPSFWSGSRFPNDMVRYSLRPSFLRMTLDRKYVDKLTALAGACCVTRKSLWKERPFNENLIGGEDSEYALYLHLKGYDIVYNPKAEVLHEHKAVTLKLSLWPEIKWRLVNIPQVIKLFVTGK